MRFDCDFKHAETGERRTVTVSLESEEVAEVMFLLSDRGPGGPGGPDGPIARGYALTRAYRQVPEGFLHEDVRWQPTTH